MFVKDGVTGEHEVRAENLGLDLDVQYVGVAVHRSNRTTQPPSIPTSFLRSSESTKLFSSGIRPSVGDGDGGCQVSVGSGSRPGISAASPPPVPEASGSTPPLPGVDRKDEWEVEEKGGTRGVLGPRGKTIGNWNQLKHKEKERERWAEGE